MIAKNMITMTTITVPLESTSSQHFVPNLSASFKGLCIELRLNGDKGKLCLHECK